MENLHVDSVIKKFGPKQVLTDVFISIKKGEIIGLLGRNGTGKSTLLKIIFGALPADNKFIKIGDKIINGLFDNRSLISFLPQKNFLPSHIKVKTTIDLFCDAKNVNQVREHNFIKPLLEKKNIQLSGGEKRLLEIFLIVYSDSKFTFIDEPFNGVAPVYKENIKELIKNESTRKGFIITDHDYSNIIDISNRLLIMHDGGTREINNKNELKYWGYIPDTG